VTGASGSGTTTLARDVADAWSVPHADADDYFWIPTDPPYADKRPDAERVALMEQVFLPREAWVLSGSMLGWGDCAVARCDAVVFLTLDPVERLRRIEARERVRRASGPVDEDALSAFLSWARGYDEPSFQVEAERATRNGWRHSRVRSFDSTVPFREKHCTTRCSRGIRPHPERLSTETRFY
jgi:hypothetical protein